jgi:molybdate transport system substrate-binding protein
MRRRAKKPVAALPAGQTLKVRLSFSEEFLRLVLLAAALFSSAALAGEAQVAVAANFASPAKKLAELFTQRTGQRLSLSSGSTGKFYAQIKSGAPFDALLSADEETPRRLEAEKLAVAGSRFTYAVGRLVLWSPKTDAVGEPVLRAGRFSRLAIANPRLAPYGAAAKETLEKLGLWQRVQPKLVRGENIAQAYQFVSSGNADLGFVALSQLTEAAGARWLVPEHFHAPLRQDAVLLRENTAARAFLDYLRSPPARERIRSYGYE